MEVGFIFRFSMLVAEPFVSAFAEQQKKMFKVHFAKVFFTMFCVREKGLMKIRTCLCIRCLRREALRKDG